MSGPACSRDGTAGEGPGRGNETRNAVLGAALLLGLGGLSIAGCFHAPFLSYDDLDLVVRNPLMKAPWGASFAKSYYTQYIPLTTISYKLNFTLFGWGAGAAWSFRLFNALLHAGSGWLLWRLLLRLGLRRGGAFFVAAAWTAHPIACESVAWITQRNSCQSVFFGMLGLWAYIRWHGRWAGLLGGTAGFACALLSKATALGFFPIFLALELLGGPERLAAKEHAWARQKSSAGAWAGMGPRLLPLFCLAGFFTWLGISAGGLRRMPPPGGHWYTALMTDTDIFVRYLGNILAPWRLSAFYGVADIVSGSDPRLWSALGWLAAGVGGSLVLARSRRRVIFGWVWFFGALGPTANLVAITYLMQDRYVYLAMAGVFLVLLETMTGAVERITKGPLRSGPRKALQGAACLCVALFMPLTLEQSVRWESAEALFAQAVERQPQSGLARFFLGITLDRDLETYRSPGPAFNPIRAQHISRRIVHQIRTGLARPDAYRYFNPLHARVILADSALALGELDVAREALREFLPPPKAPGAAALSAPERKNFRTMRYHGYPYFYKTLDLARAYQVMAEVELKALRMAARADPAPPAQDEARVRRALAWTQKALAANPDFRDSYFTRAKALLLAHPPIEPPRQEGKNKEEARRRFRAGLLERIEAPLATFERTREMQRAFRPPVPQGRPFALGCLALAEAEARAALTNGWPEARVQAALRRAIRLCARARQSDPSFDDTYWAEARMHLYFDEWAEKHGKLNLSRRHFTEARRLLKKVRPASPRYRQAQTMLRTLVPPPKAPPSQPEPEQ